MSFYSVISVIISVDPQVVTGYIDPGTGSIILQAMVGAIAGVAIAVKLFWHRILKFFGVRKNSALDEDDE